MTDEAYIGPEELVEDRASDPIDEKYGDEKDSAKLVDDLMSLFRKRAGQLDDLHYAMSVFQRMWLGEAVETLWPEASDIVPNITAKHCVTAAAKIGSAIFGSDTMFNYRPKQPEHEKEAATVTAFIQSRIAADPANMIQIKTALEESVIYGTGIVRTGLERARAGEGPDAEEELEDEDIDLSAIGETTVRLTRVRPDRLYLDPTVSHISRQRYVIEEMYLSEEDLRIKKNSGDWDEDACEKLLKQRPGAVSVNRSRIDDEHSLYDCDDIEDGMYPVLDFYKSDGWVYTVVNGDTLVRAEKVKEYGLDQGGAPFCVFHYWSDPGHAYGIGVPYILFSTQLEINTMKSLLVDEKIRTLYPPLLIDQQALPDKQKLERIEPGKIIYTSKNPRNVAEFLATNGNGTMLALQDIQQLIGQAEQLDGINETVQGMQPSGRPTATGMQLQNANAHSQLDHVVRGVSESLRHLGMLVLRHAKQMMSDSSRSEKVRMKIAGGEAWYQIATEDFDPTFDVEPGLDPNRANPELAVQKLQMFLTTVMQLAGNGMYKVPPEMIESVLRDMAEYMHLNTQDYMGPESVMNEIFGDLDYMKRYKQSPAISKNTKHEMHVMVKTTFLNRAVGDREFYDLLLTNITGHMMALQESLMSSGMLKQPIYVSRAAARAAVGEQNYASFEAATGVDLNGDGRIAGMPVTAGVLQGGMDQLGQMQPGAGPQAGPQGAPPMGGMPGMPPGMGGMA